MYARRRISTAATALDPEAQQRTFRRATSPKEHVESYDGEDHPSDRRRPRRPRPADEARRRSHHPAGRRGGRPEDAADWSARTRAPVGCSRRALSLFVAGSVLVVGIAASTFGGLWWDRHQQKAGEVSASDTAGVVSGAIGATLRSDRNFDAAVQAMVLTNPALTNRQLAAWSTAMNVRERHPGTAGFAFIEPVAASQLPGFVASVEADPPSGSSRSPYAVVPPGQRAQYCLPRLGVQYRPFGVPIGLDLCALARSPLDGVARSGASAFMTFRSILAAGSIPPAYANKLAQRFKDLIVLVTPAYRLGTRPRTAAQRVASLDGWMLGTFSIHALLRAGVRGTTHVRVMLGYRQGSGPWHAIGTAGAAPGSRLTATRTIRTGPGMSAQIDAVVTSSVGTSPFLTGLLVTLAGAAVSCVIFGFLLYFATSRHRAIELVERRTRELRHQALHDALTDLPNRALLFDRADHMLDRARREPRAVAALYVDLDDFKEINDTLGHRAGDELLRAVATRIRTVLRASDTVGRLGGDEFLVLVEGDSLDAGPELVAQRLLGVLAEPFLLETPEQIVVSVRASVGAAVGPCQTADELIRDADLALYVAKAAGKGRVMIFKPEMQAAIDDRVELEIDLHRALVEGELFVLYQPIVDLHTTRAKGAEALVRWRHPTRGVIGPDAFVPLAEETGLIVPLGRFVLDQACRQAATWREDGHHLRVAVNVSPRQLDSDSIVDDVRLALERHCLPATSLTLELTETTLMEDTDSTMRTLASLKELGVRISVDDFGTGYSSLSYLRKFPIDTLKIDRSFITRLEDSAASGPLVHSIVELGRALGIETLAEGIEDPSQLAWLQREHCDSGQGFLFGEPLVAEELEARFLRLDVSAAGHPADRSSVSPS